MIDIYTQGDRETRFNLTEKSAAPLVLRDTGMQVVPWDLIRTTEAFALSLYKFGVECVLCTGMPMCMCVCMYAHVCIMFIPKDICLILSK